MMITDFIFSPIGFSFLKAFRDKFHCSFRIDEPSGNNVLFDVDDETYRINEDESVDDFKTIIKDSVKFGKNLLIEKFRSNKVIYNKELTY